MKYIENGQGFSKDNNLKYKYIDEDRKQINN